MNKLTKAQSKRFDDNFPVDEYGYLRGEVDNDEVKQHLANELAKQKEEFYNKKNICLGCIEKVLKAIAELK